MSKQIIINFILFFIVITLGFIISNTKPKSTKLATLSLIQPETINFIKITHNKNTISLEKKTTAATKNAHWNMVKPIRIGAHNFRIKTLLNLLNTPYFNKYSLDEFDLSSIGLLEPTTKIQFNQLTFSFGMLNPVTKLRYVKIKNFIFTIEDSSIALLQSSLTSLVSLNLLSPSFNITKIEITKSASSPLISKTLFINKQHLWQSSYKPASYNQSSDRITTTVNAWANTQAFGVHQYLERNNYGSVKIYDEPSKQEVNFIITAIKPWLIVARLDLAIEYHLDKKYIATLF